MKEEEVEEEELEMEEPENGVIAGGSAGRLGVGASTKPLPASVNKTPTTKPSASALALGDDEPLEEGEVQVRGFPTPHGF